jgi:hypothetical protein
MRSPLLRTTRSTVNGLVGCPALCVTPHNKRVSPLAPIERTRWTLPYLNEPVNTIGNDEGRPAQGVYVDAQIVPPTAYAIRASR